MSPEAMGKARELIGRLHAWLVCYPIAPPHDMAQSFPDMEAACGEALALLSMEPNEDCGTCHGTGEYFTHSAECDDDLCALNGDMHSCAGMVAKCECSAPAAEGGGWRPIESAPKDGTEVLLWLGAPWSNVEKARWYEPWKNWQSGVIPADPVREEHYGIGSALPTHWQPLPEPPK